MYYVDPSGHSCDPDADRLKGTIKDNNVSKNEKRKSEVFSEQQKGLYQDARKKGVGAAEAYYIAKGKSALNATGDFYMLQREQKQVMNYYKNSTTKNYNLLAGTDKAHVVGTKTHKQVADDMRNYFAVNKDYLPYIKDIHVEENFYRGNIGVRKKGCSRLDIVIFNNVNNNVHVGDIKTGEAIYSSGQKRRNERNIRGNLNYTFTHEGVKP